MQALTGAATRSASTGGGAFRSLQCPICHATYVVVSLAKDCYDRCLDDATAPQG